MLEVNRKAFLDLISYSEGTKGKGDDGYNVDFGGDLFHSYMDHPRIRVYIPRLNLYTTAAGRYQILEKTYDVYKQKLGLADFSPASQDAVALQLIKERGALPLIDSGMLDAAIIKCANIWASFPTADYPGQRANKFSQMRSWYAQAGGVENVGDA